MPKEIVLLPSNIITRLRYHLPEAAPGVFILSSGYGNDQFEEVAQLAFIDLLNRHGIGWVQYVYPERCPENRFTDLYISTGVSTLAWIYEWVQQRSSAPIYLFGYSFGANISLEVALVKRVESVIIVNTPFDYVDYRAQQLAEDTMRKWRSDFVTVLSYDGQPYPLGYRFVQEAEQQDLERRALALDCDVQAFQAENDAILTPRHISALSAVSGRWHAHVVPGEKADHNFEHPETVRHFITTIEPVIARLAKISGNGL